MSTESLLPGTLEMLILRTLTLGEMHGYGIAQHLRQVSRDVLQVEEGSLYPALQRLRVKGWVHDVTLLNVISGGPAWIKSDKWDIEALIPEGMIGAEELSQEGHWLASKRSKL